MDRDWNEKEGGLRTRRDADPCPGSPSEIVSARYLGACCVGS